MTTSYSWQIRGVAAAQASLVGFGVELRDRVIRAALRDAVRPVADKATAALAAMETKPLTRRQQDKPRLKDSITIKVDQSGRNVEEVYAVVGPRKGNWYGAFVERGHRIVARRKASAPAMTRATRRAQAKTQIEPRPFMAPAIASEANNIGPIMEQHISRAIQRFNKRLARGGN